MGLIPNLLKGVVKLVVGKSAKKAGVDEDKTKGIIDIADQLIDDDQEIQEAVQEFIVSLEGKYSELKTKIEGIVRSMTRPFLTIMFSVNLIVMVWLDKPINQYIGYCAVSLVISWCGTKAFRDWKKTKVKN